MNVQSPRMNVLLLLCPWTKQKKIEASRRGKIAELEWWNPVHIYSSGLETT